MARPQCPGSGQPPKGDKGAFSGDCSVCGHRFMVKKEKILPHKVRVEVSHGDATR